MVKTKGPTVKPQQPKFKRPYLLIAAAVLVLLALATAGWLIAREMNQRAQVMRETAPLLTELTQRVEVVIQQTKIAREEAQLAVENQNLATVKLHVRRLYNVIVGERDGYYDAQVGNPGDGTGIVKHLEEMLALLNDTSIQQAMAALGALVELKRKQISAALENARADVLGAQLHAKAAFKTDDTLDKAQQDVQKTIAWLASAISDTPESSDPQTQTLYFAQARLREIIQAMK